MEQEVNVVRFRVSSHCSFESLMAVPGLEVHVYWQNSRKLTFLRYYGGRFVSIIIEGMLFCDRLKRFYLLAQSISHV